MNLQVWELLLSLRGVARGVAAAQVALELGHAQENVSATTVDGSQRSLIHTACLAARGRRQHAFR
jgi:hypothetical protein